MRGFSQHNPGSPSRFRLGMYKKNMELAPPRRNGLTLKWESQKRAFSTEKRVKHQFISDYANCRVGPTATTQKLSINRAIGKSGNSNNF